MKEKKIPTSMDECINIGYVPRRLWQIGAIVELVGNILMLAIYVSSLVAIPVCLALVYNNGLIDGIIAIIMVFVCLVAAALIGLIEYSIFKLIALHYYSRSKLVYNSDVTSNVALMLQNK